MVQFVGHSQLQWDLREKCSELFAKLWETNQKSLATSFDGFCFMNGERNFQKQEVNSFLHSDQSPRRNMLWSYQGLISLTENDDESGGFVCIPKTHLIHNKFFKENFNESDRRFNGDWILFTKDEKEKYDKMLGSSCCYKINVKAGDFILWDSRTFHCNTVPTKKVIRACCYICMLPKSKVPDNIKEKRKTALYDKRCCNHHPGDGFTIFDRVPKNTLPEFLKKN